MISLLHTHYRLLWWCVLTLCLLPATHLAWAYASHQLGINGLETLERTTGRWAVILLILTLVITPGRVGLVRACRRAGMHWGRRLSDWNPIVKMRRMLGLTCFAYACAHVAVYLEFDLGWAWDILPDELNEKPYLLAGMLNLVLLTVVAATSTDAMMRRLKRNWRRIHRLTYVIALLAIAHWWWMSKPGDWRALPYIAILLALLLYRVVDGLGWMHLPEDNGMPVPPREYGKTPDHETHGKPL